MNKFDFALKKIFLIFPLFFLFAFLTAQPVFIPVSLSAELDREVNALSLDEQIAQLMMVAMYPKQGESHQKELTKLIKEDKIGGLIVFQGTSAQVQEQLTYYQSLSAIPLLTAIDGEWGPGMRLSDAPNFPKAMALGSIQNDSLIYLMGKEIARELKQLGIYVNFAPVVDVNSNPNNPVIGIRSFGDRAAEVATKAAYYMNGMQNNGVMGVLKHFPGHGDTDADSHKALPVIHHDRALLDSVDLKPFRKLIDEGAMGVMSAHLHVPALDDDAASISSFSPKIIKGLLKEELGFKGLVYTDALNMKGASDNIAKGRLEVEALIAGNDILLMPRDVPAAIGAIKKAIEDKEIDETQIRSSCKKVLYFKKALKIKAPSAIQNISEDLNSDYSKTLQKKLIAESLTLLVNQNDLIPFKKLNQKRIVSINIGDSEAAYFNDMLENYTDINKLYLADNADNEALNDIKNKLEEDDVVIFNFRANVWTASGYYGFDSKWRNFISDINNQYTSVLVMFGNPYTLVDYSGLDKLNAVLLAYQDGQDQQELAAQALMGGNSIGGKLSVSISRDMPLGFGLKVYPTRLGYADPIEVGVDKRYLAKIDSIVEDGIVNHAYPGAQVLIARKGKIIYDKSFGYFTYDSIQKVEADDIYDVASVTKIAATALLLMKMEDKGMIDLNSTLGEFLPDLVDSSEYQDLNFKSLLAHQAGLRSWIPFYLNTLEKGEYKMSTFSEKKTDVYSVRVAEDLYINNSFNDSIYSWIIQTPLNNKVKYLYSDIGYYFFLKIIENENGNSLEYLSNDLFYAPLNLRHSTFLPREKFELSQIVPTEDDTLFRKQLIWGDVHDPGAAMLGGVGGHAGLFSNSHDMAVIMQMLLNKGVYGGERFLSEEVITEYTKCQFCENDNRRGAAFDKPLREGSGGPTCNCLSYDSFGHTGFTGTMVWADPQEEIVYVFLSNRIYPSAENTKLIKMNIRTKIQELIYKSLL